MPRSNRPRGSGRPDEPELNLERVFAGRLRTEQKRDGEWNVQPVSAGNAQKVYTCPGCGLEIVPGIAHLVAWRADGLFGAENDLAERRHWHSRCWNIRR
jgi:hypothetical protein